jgi:putative zinc finger protein
MFGKGVNQSACASMESKLVVYLDGRAQPAERRAVEQHLSTCEACRLRAEEFRALWGVLDDLPPISPSPSFDAAIRARIAAEPERRSFWHLLPSPRLAFAVTALVILSVWLSSSPRTKMTPATASDLSSYSEQQPVDSDFGMIKDLPVLENFDVVSKFDALSELNVPPQTPSDAGAAETR